MASKGTILLSAGGTGGHLFPAEALAHELTARGWSIHLSTDRRAGRYAGSFLAKEVHTIPAATIGGRNPVAFLKAAMTIWRGYREATKIINRIKPAAVVGFGGYPTLPPVFAATRRGIPTLIHEQNAVMGRANRALAARVDAIAGGFLSAADSVHGAKTVVTGNPVRPAVVVAADTPYTAPDGGPFRLLVFGGSQGAQYFSQAIPQAVGLLPEEYRARLAIVQQARPEDEADVTAAFGALGVSAEIAPFFTDLASRMASAHLVISRSGASTVSEIAVIGRPAVLVPYPYALDHDQAANAAALAAEGGAEVRAQKDLDADAIATLLRGYMDEPERLSAMAVAAKRAGKPDAARLLGDLTEAIASGMSVAEYKKGAGV
ncbi:MAG: undecaprenyldiphospho-muramoylpentapeptide beta-N-acetylglucosaminyltransferase [Notoacmeibacter sp.]|nr:undecaprenyldiphospho-muramoylpentapeptide beta-N-acetylglucosaminyltransferase [Notoacmeibacter sp.]